MSAPKSKATKQLQSELAEALALVGRLQHRIENQKASITRLLDGGTYSSEMEELHEQLAAALQDGLTAEQAQDIEDDRLYDIERDER